MNFRRKIKKDANPFIIGVVLILIAIFVYVIMIHGFAAGLLECEWHEYVDVIYYINLDSRSDRKTEFLEEMKRMGVPSEKVCRITAVNKPGKGDWGCSLSHIIAMKTFIDSGLDTCIIFEDDFIFNQNIEEINTAFRKVFDNKVIYDVIMISANEIDVQPTDYDNLKKVKDAQTSSGYMVNKDFANTLYENYKAGEALMEKSYESGKSNGIQGPFCVDTYWKSLQPNSNWYIFYPKLGVQRESYSDIEGVVVDYKV
jgi:hypothetical protein